MARGQETRAAFMADISRYVSDVVTAIRGGAGVVRAPGATATRPKNVATVAPVASGSRPKPPRAGAAARAAAAPSPRAARARSAAGDTPVAATLTCPRCKQGTLVAGHRGWGCSRWREGCAFVIWFEIAGRRITDAELTDLVSKGKTRKRKWRSGDGTEIGGRLVLDLSATRDAGAARLDA
jgi:DNA topoisomerase-3